MRFSSFVFLTAVLASPAQSKPAGFYLELLPRGKAVTLPLPATVFVSLGSRVSIKPTDAGQVVKLSPVNIGAGRATPIRLAIYDRHLERVRYVDLKAGLPFLYNFKGLDKISLMPDKLSGKVQKNMRLRIESNKPLEVGR